MEAFIETQKPKVARLERQSDEAFALNVVGAAHLMGIPMWRCDDLSGLQDGYTAKLLHPDTPSGRQARWETLQLLVDAIYPDGYTIIIRPRDAKKAAKLQPETNVVVDARVKSVMVMMGRKGGLKSWEVRRAKLTAADKKLIEENPGRARRRLAKKR